MNTNLKIKPIDGVQGIFTDAVLIDNGRLLFASLWGRDTAVQELLARLQIGTGQGGLRSFNFDGEEVYLGNIEDYKKITGRHVSTVFGNLIHLWIFDAELLNNNMSSRRGYLLGNWDVQALRAIAKGIANDDVSQARDLVWGKFQQLSPLPLLGHWAEILLKFAFARGWIDVIVGHDIMAVKIKLPDDYEDTISNFIKDNDLPIYADYKHGLDQQSPEVDASDEPMPIVKFVSDYSKCLLKAVTCPTERVQF